MASVYPSNSGCTRIVGEHEGSVRDARGAAETISSYLSALPTIQVRPELDGRTLDIVHCFYNIAFFTLKSQNFTGYDVNLIHLYEPSIFFFIKY